MIFPYSITGQTNDLYTQSIILALVQSSDRCITPRSLLALATTAKHCSQNFNLLSTKIPRSFSTLEEVIQSLPSLYTLYNDD